jgi:small GTP-binding protein
MGTFNTGKSTLLNAMLSQDLLSMNSVPETATVTMLRKGPEGDVFVHLEDTSLQTWPRSKLVALSSENSLELAQIQKNISFIEVPLQQPLLDKVTLIDTPGIDSLYEAHTKATEEFSRRSDAVLWVISSLMPLNRQEEKWINQLPKSVKVMVVINQVDLLDPEEMPLARLVQNVRNKLLREDVFVTAVSSKLALEGMLRSDENVLGSSLWSSFLSDCEREIFVVDTDARLSRACSAIHDLVNSLCLALSEHHRIAEQYRLKAKGGEAYHEDLELRIQELVEAEHALVQVTDVRSTVTILDIKPYWEDAREIESQRQILAETLQTIESGQASVGERLNACAQKRKDLFESLGKFRSDWDAYMKSGLFGGEPVFFKGKKDDLLQRKEALDERSYALQQEQLVLITKRNALRAAYSRAMTDCKDFVGLVQASLRKTMTSIVNESQNIVDEGIKAASHLANYEWLQQVALRLRDTNVWSLVDEANSDTLLKYAADGIPSSLERLGSTIESISSQEWRITIRKPIRAPAPPKEVTSPEDESAMYKGAESGNARGFWLLFGPVGLLLAIAIVYLTWHYRDLEKAPSQGSTQSMPALQAAPLQAPATDASIIASKLNHEALTIDGNMLDVTDATSGSTLHAVTAVCSNTSQTCHQLFVFLGSEAIWNEFIDDGTSIQLTPSSEPDRFSVILSSQATDGLQHRVVVDYSWDGKNISRTVEGNVTQSPTEDTSSALQTDSSSGAPVPPQSTATAIHQAGSSARPLQDRAATPHSTSSSPNPQVAPDLREGDRAESRFFGRYAGHMTNLRSKETSAFAVLVQETSGSLRGCMGVRAPLYGSGPVSGSRIGNSINFYVTSPSGGLKFHGDIAEGRISGTYTSSASEENGEFSLRKVGDLPSSPLGRCPTDAENNQAH